MKNSKSKLSFPFSTQSGTSPPKHSALFQKLCRSCDFNDLPLSQVSGPYVERSSPQYDPALVAELKALGHPVKRYAASYRKDLVAHQAREKAAFKAKAAILGFFARTGRWPTLVALLFALFAVGCGEAPGPVACPASPGTCDATVSETQIGGQLARYWTCGDVMFIDSVTGVCCVQGEPAGYVPDGTECSTSSK